MFKTYVKAWDRTIEDNVKYLVIPVAVDLLTIYLLVFSYGLFVRFIEIPLQRFFIDLPAERSAWPAFGQIMLVYLFTFGAFYVIMSTLHAYSWQKAFDFCKKKKKLMKSFFKINLYWVMVFALINLFRDFFSTVNIILKIEVIGQSFINISYKVLLILFAYFILISYSSNLGVKDSIVKGVKEIKKYGVAFVLVVASFVALNLIIALIGQVNLYVNFVAAIFLFLPFLTFVKVYYVLLNKIS